MALKSNNKPKSAFSLLELSIVILIIGILLIGVIGAKHIIKKSRISTAQNLTNSSPINSILDNALWLETSLDYKAFSNDTNLTTSNDSGNALEDGENINNWNDNSYNQNKITITAVGTGGKYANTINHIQAVKFEGSTDNYLQIDNASFLNNTDYTIFVLEKRLSNDSNNYFIGDSSITTNNQTLLLGYSTETSPIHSQGSSNNYSAAIESYNNYKDKPRLFTFTSDSQAGKKIYINGVLAKESNNTAQLSNITTLPIGKGYNGEIGEIVIFARNLKTTERQEIEDYLGKKWDNNVNREIISDCTTGTITNEGCIQTCQVSVVGSDDTTPKDDNETGNIACNQTGYDNTDTIAYNCQNGTTITGVCDCDTANNYVFDSQTQSCISNAPCTINNQTGIVNGTSVASGSTTLACNDPNATGGNITYSCNDGTLSNITNNCVISTPSCSGGTESDITVSGTSYHLHVFTTTGTSTLSCDKALTAQVLVVGGGGSGGSSHYNGGSGGGGAGGIVYYNSYSLSIGNYTVKVGSGGNSVYCECATSIATRPGKQGINGDNSQFENIIAYGGGGGGKFDLGSNPATSPGNVGGGGGGGGGADGASGGLSIQTAQTNETSHHGNNGGLTTTNTNNANRFTGGGGGGAGGVGGNGGNTMVGGSGGSGRSFDITGSSVYYAGGGGGSGGYNGTTGGSGGSGGGGAGGNGKIGDDLYTTTNGTSGVANTGSGGGGSSNRTSGAGGSGIVIVRYQNP